MIYYEDYKLGDICKRLSSGKSISASNIHGIGTYPVYGGNGLRGYTSTYNFEGECALIGRQGANCGNVRFFKGKGFITEHAVVVDVKDGFDARYIAANLSLMHLDHLSAQSAQPGLSVGTLSKLKLRLPSFEHQKKVSYLLASIDNRIQNNTEINGNLLQQAQALFTNLFPYGPDDALPNGWKKGTVGDIVDIHDSKRVPLSGAQRDKMTKRIYPYYGAASLMDYVDEFLFDGIYLLLGEDGTVVDEAGYPILQYVWGQFWVNNHAHILTGKNGFSVESLMLLFKRTPVKAIVTGAVQPKISQANLRSIPVVIPSVDALSSFNQMIAPMFDLIRQNVDQNKVLVQTRDTLLPKLMSGELDVSDIDL